MAFGLSISNEAGETVVDSGSIGLHYAGAAAFSANVSRTNDAFVRNREWRRYTITLGSSTAIPLAAFKPATDRWASIERVFRSAPGSATWFIDCYSADSAALAFNIADFTATSSLDVHVFSSEITSSDAWGLRLMNAAGAVSWDFGARPLWVRQVLNLPQRTDRATYRFGDSIALDSGISTPLIFGAGAHGADNIGIGAAGTHEDSEYVYQLDSSGELKRILLGTYKEFGEVGGDPYSPQPDWRLPSATLFVVDAADYA